MLNSKSNLKNAKILVIGTGGLGSPVIMILARSGIGHLGIVDYDRVEISNPPHGSDFVLEGLRMTVGLCAGADEHQVSVVFCDDGIYNLLSDVTWDEAHQKCWDMMRKLNINLHVDKDSMEERGVDEADLDKPVVLLKRKDVIAILTKSDVHMDF